MPDNDKTLLICDSAPDREVAGELGLTAINRRWAHRGTDDVILSVRQMKHERVIIVAGVGDVNVRANGEPEWLGIESAIDLAERLMAMVHVRLCMPPHGVKGLREWLTSSTPEEVRRSLDASPHVHARWVKAARKTIDEKRKRCQQPTWGQRASAVLSRIADNDARLSLRERFEERIAVLEYDCGMTLYESERAAYAELFSLASTQVSDARRSAV